MSSSRERRSQGREPAETRIQIEWVDSGGVIHRLGGQCRDVSSSGIAAVTREPVESRKQVAIRFPEIGTIGNGVVRHCNPAGARYMVGIELIGPLRSTD